MTRYPLAASTVLVGMGKSTASRSFHPPMLVEAGNRGAGKNKIRFRQGLVRQDATTQFQGRFEMIIEPGGGGAGRMGVGQEFVDNAVGGGMGPDVFRPPGGPADPAAGRPGARI